MDTNTLFFAIGVLIVILVVAVFGKNVIARFSQNGLEVEKKEGKDNVNVRGIVNSKVDADTKEGQNLTIEDVKEQSEVKVNKGK